MSRCLQSLIKQLSSRHTIDPFKVVDMYEGHDWKTIDCLYPVSLWKNDYMELYVRNWAQNEKFLYKNNYSTVHTKVLRGIFFSEMTLPKNQTSIVISQYILQDNKHTFHPFSNVILTSIQPSTTLQLYYHNHMY